MDHASNIATSNIATSNNNNNTINNRRRRTNNNTVICLNCGEVGHKSVRCQEPIKSFGIVAYKRKTICSNNLIPTDIKDFLKREIPPSPPPGLGLDSDLGLLYLLIQRRDSIAFVDLMRGNYRHNQDSAIDVYFKEMVPSEKYRLLNNSFQKNSEELWVNKRPNQFKVEHEIAARKFATLNVSDLSRRNHSKYWYTAFGFPKGRKRGVRETELECAIREFSEESGYNPDSIKVDPDFFVIERFIGSDGINYEQKYWIAECLTDDEPTIDPSNTEQIGEIGSIGWFTVRESVKLFYDVHSERKRILKEVHEKLVKIEK